MVDLEGASPSTQSPDDLFLRGSRRWRGLCKALLDARQPQPKRGPSQHHKAAESTPQTVIAYPPVQHDSQHNVPEKRDQHGIP